MIETMTDISIGTKPRNIPVDNPNYNGQAVINLFRTLTKRSWVKMSLEPFKRKARVFSENMDENKRFNTEEAIVIDPEFYKDRVYNGDLGECMTSANLGIPVGSTRLGHSREFSGPDFYVDLDGERVGVGVKTGSIRRDYNGFFTSACRVPVIYIGDNIPQVICVTDEARGFGYIVGIIFPPYGKLLKSNLVLKESIIRKFKYGLSTFDPSIVIQFNNLDELKEVLRKYRK